MNPVQRDHPAHPDHKHHAVWREYTQALLRGERLLVDWRLTEPLGEWRPSHTPEWHSANEYRIAPKLIRIVIGDVENWCPEPDGGRWLPMLTGCPRLLESEIERGYHSSDAATYFSRALRGEKLPPWGEA